jgi:hypothetical protein
MKIGIWLYVRTRPSLTDGKQTPLRVCALLRMRLSVALVLENPDPACEHAYGPGKTGSVWSTSGRQ